MKLIEIIEYLEKIAPLSYQESYDNSGLIEFNNNNLKTNQNIECLNLNILENINVNNNINLQKSLIINETAIIGNLNLGSGYIYDNNGLIEFNNNNLKTNQDIECFNINVLQNINVNNNININKSLIVKENSIFHSIIQTSSGSIIGNLNLGSGYIYDNNGLINFLNNKLKTSE